jgi:hypothetical protein
MADVRTSEMDAKLSPVNVGSWNCVCWQYFKGYATYNRNSFVINEKYEHGGGWKLKFTFYYKQTTHEQLHLDKWSFVQLKIMDIPTSLIWTIIFFGEIFKYGGISKFWGYFGINAEPLCVEFCNFVQWHTFVNYLSCYYYICHNFFQLAW